MNPLLLFCLLWGFGADGISHEGEQLGDESDETVPERHCQLVVTVAYPRACRPLCSTGAVWAFWGDPRRQQWGPRCDRFIRRQFWCGLFTTCLTTTPASAAEDVIFYAYRDDTWFGPDSMAGTRQEGSDHISTLIWDCRFTFLIWGDVFLTACALKRLTAGLTITFEHPTSRRFVSPHPAGTACNHIPGAPQRALPWLLLPLLPRNTPHQECKCSRSYTSHVAQKRLM